MNERLIAEMLTGTLGEIIHMQTLATNGTNHTTARQAGFPGFVIPAEKDTPAPRLKVTVTVSIQDTENGEKFTKVIPGQFYRGKDVTPWVVAAVNHQRTATDLDAFLRDRNVGEE